MNEQEMKQETIRGTKQILMMKYNHYASDKLVEMIIDSYDDYLFKSAPDIIPDEMQKFVQEEAAFNPNIPNLTEEQWDAFHEAQYKYLVAKGWAVESEDDE